MKKHKVMIKKICKFKFLFNNKKYTLNLYIPFTEGECKELDKSRYCIALTYYNAIFKKHIDAFKDFESIGIKKKKTNWFNCFEIFNEYKNILIKNGAKEILKKFIW